MGDAEFGIAAVFLAAYFLPTIVVVVRRHNNFAAVFLLNLLLGWTVLGWIVALIWSATDNTMSKREAVTK